MRKYILIVCLWAASLSAWAIPATTRPILHISEDGRIDTLYLHGDEYGSFRTDRHGNILSSTMPANKPSKAPQRQMLDAYVPSQGSVRIPVILVNFADYAFSLPNPVEQFFDLFNGNGGSNPKATGSVHDYYIASSDSALDLRYEVFGVYTLSKQMEYYGGNSKAADGTVGNHNVHAKELVTEAVQLAIDNGVDLSPFDNNGDGMIDNVSIIVAGYNEAEGGEERTIWPHYSVINNSGRYSGKTLSGYLMISEYRSSGGKIQAGIGTYCHEFGHALGLPDLYDVTGDKYTVGTWDIMCAGSYNNDGSTPPSFTAFERFMMGWLTPQQVSSGMQTLAPIETDNTALLIADKTHNLDPFNPLPDEYFLLENRQEVGWDAGKEALVAPGLLISHITFNNQSWSRNTFNNSQPLGFAIVSAGMSNPTKSTAADIFPGTTKRTSWIPTLNNGTLLTSLTVSQIRQRNDGYITLRVGTEGKSHLLFDPESSTIETTYEYDPVTYDTAHINLLIDSLSADTVLLSISSKNFRFSADQGLHWHSVDERVPVPVTRDSTYTLPILAIHTPTRRNCDYSYAFLTAETVDESDAAQMTLAARAPRPTYITTPVIDSVGHISSNSVTIYWAPQDDAEGYYYTFYTLGEGESEERDSLNIVFQQTGQTAQTARTLYAPKAVSLWLDNTYTSNSIDSIVGGEVHIFGSADGETWDKVTLLRVQRTTKNIVRTIDLDTTRHWRQFRLEYTHLGGSGGTVIRDWTSHFGMKITYHDSLYQYLLYPTGYEVVFRNLTPGTTYYYTMLAFEEKGCEPHYSPLSEPVAVTTRVLPDDLRLIVKRSTNGTYQIELPDMADGLHQLAVFDYMGQCIYRVTPAYGDLQVTLPSLPKGQLYLIKYFQDRMKRKDLKAKLLSY